jgi:hypothetical protein
MRIKPRKQSTACSIRFRLASSMPIPAACGHSSYRSLWAGLQCSEFTVRRRHFTRGCYELFGHCAQRTSLSRIVAMFGVFPPVPGKDEFDTSINSAYFSLGPKKGAPRFWWPSTQRASATRSAMKK